MTWVIGYAVWGVVCGLVVARRADEPNTDYDAWENRYITGLAVLFPPVFTSYGLVLALGAACQAVAGRRT